MWNMKKSWTLVTGGAKGLGAEICRTLAESGFPVVVHFRKSEKEAHEVAGYCQSKGVLAEIIQGDFTTKESTLAFIENYKSRFADSENLINNVGNFLVKGALQTSEEEWLDIFQTNLHAPFYLSQALLPSLKKRQGAIINLGVAGITTFRADSYSSAYNAAKTALFSLTKSLAKELAPYQVRVNMVSPGYMENAVDLPLDLKVLPMGRPSTLKEVASLISYLLGESGKTITGQNIEIAGGVRL